MLLGVQAEQVQVPTGTGGIIFYVEGNLLSQRSMDFDTVPDKQGRRWVESHYLFGDRQTWKIIQKKAKLDFTSIHLFSLLIYISV